MVLLAAKFFIVIERGLSPQEELPPMTNDYVFSPHVSHFCHYGKIFIFLCSNIDFCNEYRYDIGISGKVKTIFQYSSIMRGYNSTGYNTLPGSSDFKPDKIFGNPGNLFTQSMNFLVNVILIIGKMNDCTVRASGCISKLYAGSINFSDCCVAIRKRKSRMRDGHARDSQYLFE